ncbi:DUF6069 family protein [Amycolatopsis sp. GM8]|uniref:DUF6069 family protein n=1 Tax=Amycolatopsis sp. GM8 TaxID=2896530 RepID=UPI001F29D91B|nr:DUF6069 family protein [Amycolatopsis sp. GM8]
MSSSTKHLSNDLPRGYGTRGSTITIVAAVLGVVIVLAVAANTVVALIAGYPGASSGFAPLTLPVYGGFTAVGVVGGWLGWRIVQQRAARPRAVLTALVPIVTALSLVPDLLLLALHFIPGTSAAGVVVLMVMHVVVVAHAVPGYLIASRLLRQHVAAEEYPTEAASQTFDHPIHR